MELKAFLTNEIFARVCKDLEEKGAYLTDKVPNSESSNEFDNFNMKKKNLSNPTVELLYQSNILNITVAKTRTKIEPCADNIQQKKRTIKMRHTCLLPIKLKHVE